MPFCACSKAWSTAHGMWWYTMSVLRMISANNGQSGVRKDKWWVSIHEKSDLQIQTTVCCYQCSQTHPHFSGHLGVGVPRPCATLTSFRETVFSWNFSPTEAVFFMTHEAKGIRIKSKKTQQFTFSPSFPQCTSRDPASRAASGSSSPVSYSRCSVALKSVNGHKHFT